ncbi:MAG: ATP-dependent endonuclease, partial [Flavobacterium sp.]
IINAQRGFTDPNAPVNNGNLSTQLREYYSKHLNPYEKPDSNDIGALQAIETAKKSFDERLSTSFKSSFDELENLNYPGFGNPPITISSFVNPIDGINHDSAIQFGLLKKGDLDTDSPLTLPEKYNGLGYQNLISMVFKLIRFRDEWMQVGKSLKEIHTEEDVEFQPLHLILVEEPEAHLHAQVQQVFIRKAYEVLRRHHLLGDKNQFTTQLVVSTHSSHIAHEVNFTSLRYFKRQSASTGCVPTSTVINLSETFGKDDDTTKFAIRYLKTTHCDLFFADAAIIIEGPAERMLVPHFIKLHYPVLASCYISILEIGGSHAHKLRPLIEDLGLMTLVITDIDAMKPLPDNKYAIAIPERKQNYITNNDTLKSWFPQKSKIDELLEIKETEKQTANFPVKIAYQIPIELLWQGKKQEALPYTFEDSLVFQNVGIFNALTGTGLINKIKAALLLSEILDARTAIFEALQKGKKAEFALELLYLEDPKNLITPQYIAQGLEWLQLKLKGKQDELVIKPETK